MNRHTTGLPLAVIASCTAALLTGCAKSTLVSGGPYVAGDTVPPSLRYYVAKDVLVVTDTVKYELSVTVRSESLKIESSQEMLSSRPHVALRAIADRNTVYTIDLEPKGSVKDSLGVSVTADGLLTSVAYSAADMTIETVASVAKGLSTALGHLDSSAARAARDAALHSLGIKEDASSAEREVIESSPPEVAYYVSESSAGRERWRVLVELDAELDGLWKKYAGLLQEAGAASTSAEVDRRAKQATAVQAAISAIEQRRKSAQVAFEVGLGRFLAERGIGKDTIERVIVFSIGLDGLPSQVDVEGTGPDRAMDEKSVERRLEGHPWAKDLLRETRMLVALDMFPGEVHHTEREQSERGSTYRDSYAEEDAAKVFYRPPRGALLTTYAVERVPSDKGLVKLELKKRTEEWVSVLHPTDPASYVEYSAKSFAKSSFRLTFDERGRLTGLSQGSSAGHAEAAATLASAVKDAREEYLESLKKAKEIHEAQQAMRLQYLEDRISDLTKQKELIEARLGVQGATASAALVAEKSRVDAELALLRSQKSLAEEGGSIE